MKILSVLKTSKLLVCLTLKQVGISVYVLEHGVDLLRHALPHGDVPWIVHFDPTRFFVKPVQSCCSFK